MSGRAQSGASQETDKMTPLRAFLVSTTSTFIVLVVGYSTAFAAPAAGLFV